MKSLFLIFVILKCSPQNITSPCDPKNKTFQGLVILNSIFKLNSSVCNIKVNTQSSSEASNSPSPIPTTPTPSPTTPATILPNSKDITTFSFAMAQTGLNKNYNATITDTTINVDLPYGVGLNLIPTFTTTGQTVTVASVTQTSATTSNNFSTNSIYTVTAQDGSTKTYSVNVYQITPVEDTGQVNCHNDSSIQTCASVSATFPRQDGHMMDIPNSRGLTSLTTNTGYTNDFVTKNILTGIVWKTCVEDKTDSICSTGTADTMILTNANIACSNLNSANSGAGYAGLKNWRLPVLQELLQSQTYITNAVYFDPIHFPGAINAVNTRTSSRIIPNAASSFVSNGGANGSFSLATDGTATYVRCVSGGTYPNSDYLDNGDGTVTEKRSKLIWQKCAIGQTNDAACSGTVSQITWSNSLNTCNSLTLAGRTWRLPNSNELASFLDLTKATAPYVNPLFVNFPSGGNNRNFNSSTSLAGSVLYNYRFNLTTPAGVTLDTKNNGTVTTNDYNARCVTGP